MHLQRIFLPKKNQPQLKNSLQLIFLMILPNQSDQDGTRVAMMGNLVSLRIGKFTGKPLFEFVEDVGADDLNFSITGEKTMIGLEFLLPKQILACCEK